MVTAELKNKGHERSDCEDTLTTRTKSVPSSTSIQTNIEHENCSTAERSEVSITQEDDFTEKGVCESVKRDEHIQGTCYSS